MEAGRDPQSTGPANAPQPNKYGPRTCRICLEEVQPTFDDSAGFMGLGGPRAHPVYNSEDPDLGRLISPCRCSGSQKYVHTGCLDAWRRADPSGGRNLWSCPTCKFEYKMSRITWAKWIKSTTFHAVLTVVILLVTVFILGFIADPILNLWTDPAGAIVDTVANLFGGGDSYLKRIQMRERELERELERERGRQHEPMTWADHWINGFFSLGIIGFLKSFLLSPWHWWHIRPVGAINIRRPGATGRDRVENISLVLVLLGIFTFLLGVWKGLWKLSWYFLQRVEARVLDIGGVDAEEAPDAAAGPRGD